MPYFALGNLTRSQVEPRYIWWTVSWTSFACSSNTLFGLPPALTTHPTQHSNTNSSNVHKFFTCSLFSATVVHQQWRSRCASFIPCYKIAHGRPSHNRDMEPHRFIPATLYMQSCPASNLGVRGYIQSSWKKQVSWKSNVLKSQMTSIPGILTSENHQCSLLHTHTSFQLFH